MPASIRVVPAALTACAPTMLAVGDDVYPVSAGLRALAVAGERDLVGLRSGEGLGQLAEVWAAIASNVAAAAQELGVGISAAGSAYSALEAALVRLAVGR